MCVPVAPLGVRVFRTVVRCVCPGPVGPPCGTPLGAAQRFPAALAETHGSDCEAEREREVSTGHQRQVSQGEQLQVLELEHGLTGNGHRLLSGLESEHTRFTCDSDI